VPPNGIWGNGFQAQVTITNPTASAHDWQVTLVYPPSVTNYVASWVDGVPQPNVSVVGQRFNFTSTVPLPPGRTALLRGEFTKIAGPDFAVMDCEVNGDSCDQ
jgi:hypothetical protein